MADQKDNTDIASKGITKGELKKIQEEAGIIPPTKQPAEPTNPDYTIVTPAAKREQTAPAPSPETPPVQPVQTLKPGEFPTMVNQSTAETSKPVDEGGFFSKFFRKKSS